MLRAVQSAGVLGQRPAAGGRRGAHRGGDHQQNRQRTGTSHVLAQQGSAGQRCRGRWSTALCRSAGFEPDVRFESTDLRFHLRLVETGHAAALVPDLARRADDDVHFEPVPGRPARRVFTATRRGAGERPAIQAVRDGLRHAIERRAIAV
ncbi:MAG TPA: LysR substrate-binding domain-containing protein [Mycobacterium sp.]|nr:LysR substrate-binding domain-containing protein [Mycobacterium sp.]